MDAPVFKIHTNITLKTQKIKNEVEKSCSYIKPNLGINKGLITLDRYIEMEEAFYKIVESYKELIKKDMLDLEKMIGEIMKADSEIGREFK